MLEQQLRDRVSEDDQPETPISRRTMCETAADGVSSSDAPTAARLAPAARAGDRHAEQADVRYIRRNVIEPRHGLRLPGGELRVDEEIDLRRGESQGSGPHEQQDAPSPSSRRSITGRKRNPSSRRGGHCTAIWPSPSQHGDRDRRDARQSDERHQRHQHDRAGDRGDVEHRRRHDGTSSAGGRSASPSSPRRSRRAGKTATI